VRLAPRLVLAFASVAALSVAGLGYVVRVDRRTSEQSRFEQEVTETCRHVDDEIRRQADADERLIAKACQSEELVDRALMGLEYDDMDNRSAGLALGVKQERQAFDLDELMLVADKGYVIGFDPPKLASTTPAQAELALRGDATSFALRAGDAPAIVVRCKRQGKRGHVVGLVGARAIPPLLVPLAGKGVTLTIGQPPATDEDTAQRTCPIADAAGVSVPIVVTKSRAELRTALEHIDETVLYAGLTSIGVALVIAVLLARSLGRPIAELAAEARKVATGDARPLRVRAYGEIGDLVDAFDRMLVDLAATRRRLAATSRVAAWREVARRVAHEVKNPLAPIRAAVETLRRLRARQDPAFDEYFDEATRTVLDEVHRISNIVTEFTRFARLPPPRPQETDLVELTRQVVQLQKASAADAKLDVVVRRKPPLVMADRDQVIQVLTNLVKNALEAVQGRADGAVEVALDGPDPGHAEITVSDNGPGIAPEIAQRLFEPYATTKAHGTGLGLAIAQRVAIEHNGELSHVGQGPSGGAAFRLVLPVEGPPPESDLPTSG
jgi:signal transduction histidine kinase